MLRCAHFIKNKSLYLYALFSSNNPTLIHAHEPEGRKSSALIIHPSYIVNSAISLGVVKVCKE